MGITIQQIIASNYIKYDRLTQMVNTAFVGSDADKVNIFIDMNSCIKQIFSPQFHLSGVEEETAITALMVNMIAHYRRFFRTRYNVASDVYIVYSSNTGRGNKLFFPKYNSKAESIYKQRIGEMNLLTTNLALLEQICPYLPDTAFCAGTSETSVIMKYIMENNLREEYKDSPRIIISKDIMCTQLVATDPRCIVFRPKKVNSEDISYFISTGGCIQNMVSERQIKQCGETIGDGLLSMILALSRVPERDIGSLLDVPKAIKVVEEGVLCNYFVNGYNSNISLIYETFEEPIHSKVVHGAIDSRFKAIDLLYQYNMFCNSPERLNILPIKNLYSPNSIHDIANKYFKAIPLDLENL